MNFFNRAPKHSGIMADFQKFSGELFEVSPEAILIVDNNGRIVTANRRLSEWLNVPLPEIVNKHFNELTFIDPASMKVLTESFQKKMRGEDVAPYEISLRVANNIIKYGRVISSLLRGNKNEVLGEMVMISDITTSKEMSNEEVDVVGGINKLSKSALGFVELGPEDDIYLYIGNCLLDLFPGSMVSVSRYIPEKKVMIVEHYLGLAQKYEKIVKYLKAWPTGQEWPLNEYARKNLESSKLNRLPGGVYEMAQGKLPKASAALLSKMLNITDVYSMGFAWDNRLFGTASVIVTNNRNPREEIISAFIHQASVALRRKQAEDELRRAHAELEIRVQERTADLAKTAQDLEKFRLAVKDASDQIIITDPDGKILYANHATELITGFSEKDVVGRTPAIWGNLMDDNYYKQMWKAIKSGQPFIGELKEKRRDGEEFYAELHISPVIGDREEIMFFVGILRDITKAKEIDQAKTEFVSLASHQLRTPLSAINWYTEMLIDGDAGNTTDLQKEYLREIYNGSQRMVDLVNSLLNVSRLELGTFIIEPVNTSIVSICDDVLNELKSNISKKNIIVTKKYKPDLPDMMLDPKLVRIVFQNLLSNAVKYTPDRGKVEVVIDKVEKFYRVVVTDSGYGIPKKQQSKIFTKLFRADNVKKLEVEGTGLGLYIIKQILENSGCEISFSSKEGKGTEFVVKIPEEGMRPKRGSRELN